jgi:putative transposase
MVDKSKRKISSKTARNMLSLSHYKFKQIIKFVANNNRKFVIDVNEAYTSKTVSWTGEIIEDLNGKKVIKSNIDGRIMDRDYNGARGIFLRSLRGDTP